MPLDFGGLDFMEGNNFFRMRLRYLVIDNIVYSCRSHAVSSVIEPDVK